MGQGTGQFVVRDADRIDADPRRAWTLPSHYYTTADVLEAERERVFLASWQYVGHESEISAPGAFRVVDLLDQSVVLLRDEAGEVRCYHNVCAHRAHRVLEGSGQCRRIICPYHAWSYGLDGRLLHARGTAALPGFEAAATGLSPVRTATLCGLVFADLGGHGEALDEAYAGLSTALVERLPAVRDFTVEAVVEGEIEANWKVVVDNCLECYHCHPAHPAFVDLIDMDTYRVDLHARWIESAGTLRREGNRAYPVAPDAACRETWFAWLWPNVQIGVIPGSPNLSVYTIAPLSPDRARWRMTRLALPGASDANDAARARYRIDVLGPEDTALCESVQRGLHSVGYSRGRFVVDEATPHIGEHGLHCFQRLVQSALAGEAD